VEVRNCKRCGSIFRATGGNRYCARCMEEERAIFESVKDFLRKRPRASVIEVSEQTGVPVSKIREYVREGRLVAASDDWKVACERCGREVERGRYCPDCLAELERELAPARPVEKREMVYTPRERMKVHWDRFRRR